MDKGTRDGAAPVVLAGPVPVMSRARPEIGLQEAEFEGAPGGEAETVRAEKRIGRRDVAGANAGDGTEKSIHRGVDYAGAVAAPAGGRY